MINREQAIDIIKAERECVYRQGRTGECCRDDLGCGACDLVMEDKDIIEAYDMAIEALKEETICPVLSDDEVKQPCIKSPCGIERPHGKWKNRNGNTTYPFWERYECSECNSISGGGNFCNHCGADMRTKEGGGS